MRFALSALLDALLVCLLLRLGRPFEASQWCGFAAGFALLSLLTGAVRSAIAEAPLTGLLKLAALLGLGFFLRSGVLTLLMQNWHVASTLAVFLAAPAGLAPLYYAHPSRSGRDFAVGFIAYAIALRVLFAASVEMMPEETYYWNYAQHLDLGYLDHPPMVAWLVRASTALLGQTEFAVRLGPLLCGLTTSFFLYRLTRNLFGAEAALAALLLVQGLPFFFLAGMLMTPDAPLTAAWAASLYFLERALVRGNVTAWWFAGICLGLGLISKYSILMLGAVAAAFMLWDKAARRWWLRPAPYAGVLLALLIFSPVIIWNAEHEWASFAFQTSRRLAEAPRFSLHKLIASALILITPTGVAAVIWALAAKPSSAEISGVNGVRAQHLLKLAALLPLCVFALFSLRHEVKLDWTGAPWVAMIPLMARGMSGSAQTLSRFARRLRTAWPPTLSLMLLVYAAGLTYLAAGLPGVAYSARMELLPVGWRELSRQIEAVAESYHRQSGNVAVMVGMDRYAISSELCFYGLQQTGACPEVSGVHLFGGVGLMYERWSPAERMEQRTLLLVAQSRADMSDAFVAPHADHLGPIQEVYISRDGKVVRTVYYRFAYGYRAK